MTVNNGDTFSFVIPSGPTEAQIRSAFIDSPDVSVTTVTVEGSVTGIVCIWNGASTDLPTAVTTAQQEIGSLGSGGSGGSAANNQGLDFGAFLNSIFDGIRKWIAAHTPGLPNFWLIFIALIAILLVFIFLESAGRGFGAGIAAKA